MGHRQDYVRIQMIPLDVANEQKRAAVFRGKIRIGATITFWATLILGVFMPVFWIVPLIPLGILVKMDKSKGAIK